MTSIFSPKYAVQLLTAQNECAMMLEFIMSKAIHIQQLGTQSFPPQDTSTKIKTSHSTYLQLLH